MWIAIQNAVGARQGVGGGPGPDPFTGFLDTPYGSGAVAAFSVRRLSSSTNEVLRVIRDTNGGFGHHDLIDVTFDASNNISLDSPVSNPSSPSAATNLGQFFGNPAYGNPDSLPATTITGAVHTWYDQVGTNHAVQTDYLRQPRIYSGSLSSGSLVLTGARLRLARADSRTSFELSTTLTDSDLDIFTVSNPSVTSGFLSSDPNDILLVSQQGDSADHTTRMGTPSFYLQGNSFTGTNRGELYTALGGDVQNIVDAFNVDVSDAIYTRLGWPDVSVPAWEMQEVIFYNTDKTGSRQQIEENLNEYYQVTNLPYYTSGFLADYSDAAAAYSVRKLSNTAIKCMRVRRTVAPFDELDIGFTPAGDLDEQAIVDFGGSDVLVVSRWYDQSGQSNHAVQETPGSQPQIYNGTAVITDNGKPALNFDGTDNFYASGVSLANSLDAFFVSHKNSTARQAYYAFDATTNTNYVRQEAGDPATIYAAFNDWGGPLPILLIPSQANNQNQILVNNFSESGSQGYQINGSSIGTNTNVYTPTAPMTGLYIAVQNNGANDLIGTMQEFVLFSSVQSSSNRTGIETNINDYYYAYNTSGFVVDYPGAIAAYSVRQLGNRQRYAMRVRRLGGAADYLDVGFVSGELDTQAIIDFGGSDTLGVEVWYDQSRSGNDVTNTSTTTMPIIYNGSSVITDGGKPALGRNSAGLYYQLTNIVPAGVTQASFIAVTQGPDAGTLARTWYGSGGGSLNSLTTGNNLDVYNGGSPQSGSGPAVGRTLGIQLTDGNPGAAEKGWRNGVLNYSADSGPNPPRTNALGSATLASSPLFMQEMILYPSDIDAGGTRTNIETNINTYYGVYFLLDSNPAAAAYSVRLLSSSYSGSALRVRRNAAPFDEQDIGFDSNGDLDTAAIASFGGSDVLTVSRWYDQSGGGNDATQVTPNQPRIYNGTTVDTENGKPALTDSLGTTAMSMPAIGSSSTAAIFSVVRTLNSQRCVVYSSNGYLGSESSGNLTINMGAFISGTPLPLYDQRMQTYLLGTTDYGYINGTLNVSGNGGSVVTGQAGTIGANNSTGTWDLGSMQEVIVFLNDQTYNRESIENNTMFYYNIP